MQENKISADFNEIITQSCSPLHYDSNPVLQWNYVALEVALIDSKYIEYLDPNPNQPVANRDQGGVPRTSRAMAMVHAAIYNAVVGLVGKYKPYGTLPAIPTDPKARDVEAAVASAAYTMLQFLYPQQSRTTKLRNGSYTVYKGKGHLEQAYLHVQKRVEQNPLFKQSITFGYNVAVRIFNTRRTDNSFPRKRYPLNNVFGVWRPDILDPKQVPLDPHWGGVTPFLLQSNQVNTVFSSVPQPFGYVGPDQYDPQDQNYRNERQTVIDTVNKLNDVGKRNAAFWSYDEGRGTPIRLYNQAVRSVIIKKEFEDKFDIADFARWFFYTNLVMADAAIIAWKIKYHYRLWRPIHAAQLDPVKPNPSWIPFGKRPPYAPLEHSSPPFPSYVSGHSTIGRALFNALTRLLGTDRCTFGLYSEELPGETFVYDNFSTAADAIDISRIQLGVHYPMDAKNGSQAGKHVGELAFANLPGESGVGVVGDTRNLPDPPFTVEDPREKIDTEVEEIDGYGDQETIKENQLLKEL